MEIEPSCGRYLGVDGRFEQDEEVMACEIHVQHVCIMSTLDSDMAGGVETRTAIGR